MIFILGSEEHERFVIGSAAACNTPHPRYAALVTIDLQHLSALIRICHI
jgi:hypothetical protein